MTKKLDSVRRSLFQDFESEDDSLEKLYNDPKKTSRISIKLNSGLIASVLLIMVAIAAITSNKVIQMLLKDMTSELHDKFISSLEWTQTNYTYLTEPLLFALFISIFTMTIIYFDSDVPGICPPTPFSPRKARQIRYYTHKEKTSRLSFWVSIGSGVVTFFLLCR